MTEAPAPAVKHDHNLIGNGDPEDVGPAVVQDIFPAGHLDFEVMIPGPEGADLVEATVDRFFADLRRVGAFNTA